MTTRSTSHGKNCTGSPRAIGSFFATKSLWAVRLEGLIGQFHVEQPFEIPSETLIGETFRDYSAKPRGTCAPLD